jgi:hypothetical protein
MQLYILHQELEQLCQYSVGLQTGRQGFDPQQTQRIFPLASMSRSAENHPDSHSMGTESPLHE